MHVLEGISMVELEQAGATIVIVRNPADWIEHKKHPAEHYGRNGIQ